MTPADLHALVAVMRELGVLEADGVKLGPAPTTKEDLRRAARAEKDPKVKAEMNAAAKEEERREYVAAWHSETRELLSASHPNISDDECEKLRPVPDA